MNEVKKYLDKVCEQIRFQKAHESIKTELQQHIIDQANAYMEEGMEEQKAFETAVVDMGDPVLVGTELDRVHRPKLEWGIIIFVALLSFAHIAVQYIFLKDVLYVAPLFQNIIIMLIYVGIMALFYHMDFTILAKHGKLLYGIYVVLLGVTFYFSRFDGWFLSMDLTDEPISCMGAYTDIYYCLFDYGSPIRLPVLLYFYTMILPALLYQYREKGYKAVVLCCCSILPVLFFSYYSLLEIPCIVITIVSFILIFLAIIKNWFAVNKKYAVFLVFFMIIFTALLIKWLHKSDCSYSSAYHSYMEYIQSILRYNIQNSRLIGEGKEILIQEYRETTTINGIAFIKQWVEYLPAYILHRGGWIALLPMLVIYFFSVVKCFLLVKKQKSQLGFMIATAILLLFFGMSLWNIVANSGLFLATNPLGIPFFSTSDSVNVIFFAMLGVLLSVFRTGRYDTTEQNNTTTQNKRKFIIVSENNIHITIPIFWRKKQRH